MYYYPRNVALYEALAHRLGMKFSCGRSLKIEGTSARSSAVQTGRTHSVTMGCIVHRAIRGRGGFNGKGYRKSIAGVNHRTLCV